MNTYRSPYIPRDEFVDEENSGVQLTMPDMSKSIQDIISMSMAGQDPMMSYVPDIAFGQDLSDVYPNVDELGVLDETINLNPDENVKDNTSMRDVGNSDTPAVSEETEKK